MDQTTNGFHPDIDKCNRNLQLTPSEIFAVLVTCLYLCTWVLTLSVFRFTFCSTLQVTLEHPFQNSNAIITIGLVLGMLSNWLLFKTGTHLIKLLLTNSMSSLAGSALLFFIQQRFILYLLFLLFFSFGNLITTATILFQQYIPRPRRFYVFGFVLATNSVISQLIRSLFASFGLTTIFTVCFIATLLITILSAMLYTKPLPEPNIKVIEVKKPELNMAYFHLLVYIAGVFFIKGILFQEIPFLFFRYSSVSSAALCAGYVMCILAVTRLMNKRHIGISIYLSNSVFLFAFICYIINAESAWLSILFAAVMFATFALNDLFIYDTLFAFGDRYSDSSNIFGIGFGVSVFSLFLGQLVGIYVQDTSNFHEWLVTIAYSVATLVLPYLRLSMTKLLSDTAFRVRPIDAIPDVEYLDMGPVATPLAQEAPLDLGDGITSEIEQLSQRENEVLNLLLKGYPNELIASTLFISNNTLKKHIQNIYNKLGVHSRSELFILMKSKD